jgi:3-hydroxyisobutyrate dehydrogenase-like beta-hydroxyacid dehydrogenase
MGLDLAGTLAVIEQSSGQSWIGSDRMRRAIAGDLVPRAHTSLLSKDTRLAVEMARSAAFEVPLGAEAAATFARACEAGFAALDDASLLVLNRQVRPR